MNIKTRNCDHQTLLGQYMTISCHWHCWYDQTFCQVSAWSVASWSSSTCVNLLPVCCYCCCSTFGTCRQLTCSVHTSTALTIRPHGLGNDRGFFSEVSLTTWRVAGLQRRVAQFSFFEWLAAQLRGRDGDPLQVRGDVPLPGRRATLRHWKSFPSIPTQVYLPPEAAYNCVAELGELGDASPRPFFCWNLTYDSMTLFPLMELNVPLFDSLPAKTFLF